MIFATVSKLILPKVSYWIFLAFSMIISDVLYVHSNVFCLICSGYIPGSGTEEIDQGCAT
jgi:hypothetical protein